MPGKLASADIRQAFWYRPIVAPPKSYEKWNAFMKAFAQHLIDRYGIDEVAQWYFEVWNEPNLDFLGRPAERTDLLQTLRRDGAIVESGESAAACGRTGDGAGRVGG